MMTCEVCNHKMTKTFTKKSYHTGVVIINCDNCNNNHLIADNLGWFREKSVNIEDLAREKGDQAVRVQNNIRLHQILKNIKYVGHNNIISPEKEDNEQKNDSENQNKIFVLGEKETESQNNSK